MKIIHAVSSDPYCLLDLLIRYLIKYNVSYVSIKNTDNYELHFNNCIFKISYGKQDTGLDGLLDLVNIKKVEEIKIVSESSKKRYRYRNDNHVLKLTKGKNRKLNHKQFRRKW